MFNNMSPEPLTYELDPATKTTLKMYLFKNIQNVEEIRNKVIKGVWRCAVIKPDLIMDPFQVAIAANKAAVSDHKDMLITKSVYSEILYNLSLSKNITQSLGKFGIQKDPNVIFCFLNRDGIDHSDEVLSQIDGELCPISELPQYTDLHDVRKTYKLETSTDEELLDNIVNRIVTKNFVSY